MSYEKLGKIVQASVDGIVYKRKLPGVNFPTDFMTDEEIEKLSGEVTIYYLKEEKYAETSSETYSKTKKTHTKTKK